MGIGIFFALAPKDNPALEPLFSSLSSVTAKGSEAPSSRPFSLSSLLPESTQAFYRYSGSLTTPGCNEVVTWTLLHSPSSVSESQLEGLRLLLDSDGDRMGDNFRPVQNLHGRKVVVSGLKAPLVIQYEEKTPPDQWYHSMVPGWAVLLLCLAVGLNVGALVFMVMRQGRRDRLGRHHRVPTEEPKL